MNALEVAIAHPHSIAARRALAEQWKLNGDPRHALVERQLQIHDGMARGPRLEARREVREMLGEHGRDWAGSLADLVESYEFEFGLVSDITMRGDLFVEHAAAMFSTAPIVRVVLTGPVDPVALARVPAIGQLTQLHLPPGPWLNDAAVAELAKSPYVRRVRILGLRQGQLSATGYYALSHGLDLHRLVYADLSENPCANEELIGMAGQRIGDEFYLLGDAGHCDLVMAQEEAARGSDPWGPPSFPPDSTKYAFAENDNEVAAR